MSEGKAIEEQARERLLSPVDRVSEMLFGLFMALTFVGAVSAANSGREEIRTMFITALGCNLAWGLVDAVMYLVRTIAERGRKLTLVQSVRSAPDARSGRRIVASSLSEVAAGLVSEAEIEAVRARVPARALRAGERGPRDARGLLVQPRVGRPGLRRLDRLHLLRGRLSGPGRGPIIPLTRRI